MGVEVGVNDGATVTNGSIGDTSSRTTVGLPVGLAVGVLVGLDVGLFVGLNDGV